MPLKQRKQGVIQSKSVVFATSAKQIFAFICKHKLKAISVKLKYRYHKYTFFCCITLNSFSF